MTEKNFDLTELVRSLQRREGQQDCFRQGAVSCDRVECKWRGFCLAGPETVLGRQNKPEK